MEINTADALEYITEKFRAEGDFAFIPEDDLHKVVASLLQIDNGYMSEAGVYEGGIYDEDEAYEMLSRAFRPAFLNIKCTPCALPRIIWTLPRSISPV